ncbi:S-layer homology domain-containing protein [Pseudoflavonifractor sp. 60]|uniref:S-layer homology domain-containing protein n=1 Tax=Pseudoflavonifractor sp. 60 TaxID=2304576 RepID=UPI00136B9AC8|nr:S-layer homology domain-containing protein [Pseudoflavonifractor sp. 60]NBI65910.1 S-layer homology domain-containing protein [Pseudoflavonifractor sp. 60]
MRNTKRLTAAILTAALALALLVLPAPAAPSSFGDISDSTTAVNADILRLMGVVTGTGDGRFNPDGTLTRAQFCTMVINFLQKGDEVAQYATRTIFSDVKGDHWARSYVNLAASYSPVKEGDKDIPLISGVGDGRFQPDSTISQAEAVTILLRALRYTSQQTGAVWPQGFMNLAGSIGLTAGLPADYSAGINRAQAAQLFVNALKCKDVDGKVYYESLGTVLPEKTIILAVNVETDDGSTRGAIRTSSNQNSEAYLPAHGDGNPASLQGKRGNLVLNDKEEIVTFIPDDSTAVSITLSGDAQSTSVKDVKGAQYTISARTPVYTASAGQSTSYLDAYTTLYAGTQLMLYSEKGKVVAVYATSTVTTADSDAVVILERATAASFHKLTGGVTDFKIVKNRQSVGLSDIKPYDVVTYDQMTNTLVVSDLRITATYADPKPSAKTPQTLSVVGNEFQVLESAWDTIGDLKPGDSVSLLLTADGKVAGILPSSPQTRSTAVGVVEGGSAKIFLPNGGTMTLSGTITNGDNLQGQLAVITAGSDHLSAGRLSENRAPGAFQISSMKLGSYNVSPGVRIFERVSSGATVPISLSTLTMEQIEVANIYAYHMNSSNVVDYIVLREVTGSAYIYGMMVGGYSGEPGGVDEEGNTIPDTQRHSWYLRNGSSEISFISAATYAGESGDMVGVIVGTPIGNTEGSQHTLTGVIKLTEITGVKGSDFFESQGANYVTAKGETYRIADDVEGFYCRSSSNRVAQENWLTGEDRLAAIKGYSQSFTIYVDPVGQQVRIIEAK